MPYRPDYPIVDGYKTCTKCRETKPVSEFPVQTKVKSGVRSACKVCCNTSNRQYYENNKDAVLAKTRDFNKTEHRKKYIRDYQRARERRLRDTAASRPRPLLCEACGSAERVVYDHHHGTGLFRGWLCDRCNRCLGLLEDDPQLLRLLASYLEQFMAKSTAGIGPKGKAKMERVFKEWGAGDLHSGSKRGPKVTSQKQAVAIALNQARKVSRARGR